LAFQEGQSQPKTVRSNQTKEREITVVNSAVKSEVNADQTIPNSSKTVPINVAFKSRISAHKNEVNIGQNHPSPRCFVFWKLLTSKQLQKFILLSHMQSREGCLQVVRTNQEGRERYVMK